MTVSVVLSVGLFCASLVFGLVQYIVTNLFTKKLDELNAGFKELAGKLEQYVKVQDHKEDLGELKRRLEKIEDKVSTLDNKGNQQHGNAY